jgi:hypothetical protein
MELYCQQPAQRKHGEHQADHRSKEVPEDAAAKQHKDYPQYCGHPE